MLALLSAGCGDNTRPAHQYGAVQAGDSGGLVATSQHYRIVSTVTSGDLSAASRTHTVRSGIAVDQGGR